MRRILAFLLVLSVLSIPSLAHAAESEAQAERGEDDPNDDVRPVEYASVELNPLATSVDRYGGQLQVALMGPLTLVGGASRLENAAVRGWALELGSRLYFGLAPRRPDGTRIAHIWLGASYLADDLHVGDVHGERRGVALDVGLVGRVEHGFYVLAGIGVAHRATDLPIADRFEQMTTTPRLLFSLGWGL